MIEISRDLIDLNVILFYKTVIYDENSHVFYLVPSYIYHIIIHKKVTFHDFRKGALMVGVTKNNCKKGTNENISKFLKQNKNTHKNLCCDTHLSADYPNYRQQSVNSA